MKENVTIEAFEKIFFHYEGSDIPFQWKWTKRGWRRKIYCKACGGRAKLDPHVGFDSVVCIPCEKIDYLCECEPIRQIEPRLWNPDDWEVWVR